MSKREAQVLEEALSLPPAERAANESYSVVIVDSVTGPSSPDSSNRESFL
jgi:hypothetical protein